MYTFFAFHPILELLYHFKFENIPKNLDYIFAILAFIVEAFVFHEHLHGRAHMDIQLHTYQILAVVFCAIFTLCEMVFIDDVRPALARACAIMLQGTWFLQVLTNFNSTIYIKESYFKNNVKRMHIIS